MSSSPEPETIPTKQKTKEKTKKGSQSAVAATGHGKNEGNDPHWAYKPPPGAVLVDHEVDVGEFEWDNVEDDDDVELWLIRIPDGVKPKFLENLKIHQPSSTQTTRLGSLDRKHATFDILSVKGDDDPSGGEEIKALSCLLPRKNQKGKLYQTVKPIAHHLVISAQAILPTPDRSCERTSSGAPIYRNPPRHMYPKELLKHRFYPYGSQAPSDNAVFSADVEMATANAVATDDVEMINVVPQPKEQEMKDKGRKRRGDDVTPKKAKKVKRAA